LLFQLPAFKLSPSVTLLLGFLLKNAQELALLGELSIFKPFEFIGRDVVEYLMDPNIAYLDTTDV
jgi:hypothetical protein